MRRFAAAVAVVLVLAACGDGVEEPGVSASSVPAGSTPLSGDQAELRSALSAIDDDGLAHEPILVMTRVCYSMGPRAFARPEFAMYPDGSWVAVDRQPPDDSDSFFRLRVFAAVENVCAGLGPDPRCVGVGCCYGDGRETKKTGTTVP